MLINKQELIVTTIFSDGNFLIADKRTTVTVAHQDAIGGQLDKTSNFLLECSPKIHIPSKPLTCKVGMRGRVRDVAALSFAGDTAYAKKVVALAEKGFNLFDVMYMGGPFYAKDPGMLMALCTDGTTVRITQTKNGPDVSTKSAGSRNGLILGAGSGAKRIEGVLGAVDFSKLTAMDAFTYAVYCDPSSNNRCDVYSLKEKRLFQDVRISRENLDKVLKILKENTAFDRHLK